MKIANRNAIAVSDRSPPESNEMPRTRLRPGLASISIPRRERIGRVGEHEPSLPAGEQLGDQPLELLGHVAERRGERLGDLAVDLGDDLEQVATSLAHVVELTLHEVVALLERLELAGREQVHPAEQGEAALHELLALLDRLDGVVLGQGRDAARRGRPGTLPGGGARPPSIRRSMSPRSRSSSS